MSWQLTIVRLVVMCACLCLVVWAESVTSPGGSLSTVGGSLVVITGTNLGLSASAVTVTYSGGATGMQRRQYTIPSGGCVITSVGFSESLQCQSVAGVGANYSFTVIVDGGVSSWTNGR